MTTMRGDKPLPQPLHRDVSDDIKKKRRGSAVPLPLTQTDSYRFLILFGVNVMENTLILSYNTTK